MSAAFRVVPGLVWLGVLWAVLGLLVEDQRGLVIGGICVFLGIAQGMHRPGVVLEARRAVDLGRVTETVVWLLVGAAILAAAGYGWTVLGTARAAVVAALVVGILALLLVSALLMVLSALQRDWQHRHDA